MMQAHNKPKQKAVQRPSETFQTAFVLCYQNQMQNQIRRANSSALPT